ncbi:ImuA family protein [Phreatobacter sp.]|uniref:ImuA family protein n=1 Tax=Phreatobacter sp. TaxID=1966341 RepID=UPI003F6FFA54
MRDTRDILATLRQSLAPSGHGSLSGAATPFPLGAPEIDGPLGGGLARGGLHEVFAAGDGDIPASTGFALGLASRAAGSGPVVWVRQDMLDGEAGMPYGPGVAELGLDPGRLVLVRARNAEAVLRAALEAAHTAALGALVVEAWGMPALLDLTASRRLGLAADAAGVTTLMTRPAGRPVPSAAVSRWQVRARLSRPLAAGAPGSPAFAVTLLRHRGGLPPQDWFLEWDRDRCCFRTGAALSRAVPAVPAHRAAPPTGAGTVIRRAG